MREDGVVPTFVDGDPPPETPRVMGRWAYESAKKAIREKPGIWAMVPSVTGRWGRANAYARAKKWATEGFDVRVVRHRSTYYFYARWPEKED